MNGNSSDGGGDGGVSICRMSGHDLFAHMRTVWFNFVYCFPVFVASWAKPKPDFICNHKYCCLQFFLFCRCVFFLCVFLLLLLLIFLFCSGCYFEQYFNQMHSYVRACVRELVQANQPTHSSDRYYCNNFENEMNEYTKKKTQAGRILVWMHVYCTVVGY